jgi:hypothetical protein
VLCQFALYHVTDTCCVAGNLRTSVSATGLCDIVDNLSVISV